MGLLKKILPFTGLFILIFIIVEKINFHSLIQVINKVNAIDLILGILFTFFVVFIKMFRTYKILEQNNINLPFLNFLEIYVNANILSLVTTPLFSETTAAIATMHKKENKTRVANIFFLCNFTDLSFIMLLFLITLILNYKTVIHFLSFDFGEKNVLYLSGIFIIAIFIIMIFFYKIIFNFFVKIIKDLNKLLKKSWKKLLFITSIIYICYTIACFFNAHAFNININFFYILFVYTAGSLINIIPISINGLGTREAAFIILLEIQGISPEHSFSFSFFSFVIIILFSLTLIYLFIIIAKQFKRAK